MKIKFKKIKKKLNTRQFKNLIFILRSENKNSILASLSDKNINYLLQEVIKSKKLELFVLIEQGIIAYAILAAKPKYLTEKFERYRLRIFIDLFIKLKIRILCNIFLSIFNLDILFIPNIHKRKISESLNLNLYAVKKNYQNKGLGKKFLEQIIKNSIHKSKYITCETDNERATNFYKKKLKFKSIGKKIRFFKLQSILVKKV
jgi:hypothetical protein